MSAHPFDLALVLEPAGEDHWRGHTSADYANMIGPYGGLTAAQALQAVLLHPKRLGDPVAFTVNFAAALADGPFEVEAVPVRTNRSTQHWTIHVRQAGEVAVTATAVTALRRETWGTTEATMPGVPRPLDVPLPPFNTRFVPWLGRYEMRFVEGGISGEWNEADAGDSRTLLWVRDQPPRPLDFASLTALSDVFFPRIWRRRAKLVPVGTVSMTVYFHADAAEVARCGSAYLLGQAQGQGFGGGYFDHTAQLWSEAGRLMATTHQVVYYKE